MLLSLCCALDPAVHERVDVPGLRAAHAELLRGAPRAAGPQALRVRPGGGGDSPGARAGPEHNHHGSTEPAATLGAAASRVPAAQAAARSQAALGTPLRTLLARLGSLCKLKANHKD